LHFEKEEQPTINKDGNKQTNIKFDLRAITHNLTHFYKLVSRGLFRQALLRQTGLRPKVIQLMQQVIKPRGEIGIRFF
jgi:hypothetical protein